MRVRAVQARVDDRYSRPRAKCERNELVGGIRSLDTQTGFYKPRRDGAWQRDAVMRIDDSVRLLSQIQNRLGD
ncbi:MAG: hypothetical protein ACRENH_12105 [Gemmatimonadaceae bacterium]